MKKKKDACPCCGHHTLDNIGRFDICPVCYWEDDGIQRDDINFWGGANEVSLKEARENYKSFGASELIFKDSVRLPKDSEINPNIG